MTPPAGRPRLLVATTNPGKLREYRQLAEGGPLGGQVEVISLTHPDLAGRDVPAVEEASPDLGENAAAKARAASAATGLVAVADDTGLYVDALGGQPGSRAARFAGPDADDARRVALLLERLRGVPPERRTARFRCAVAVATPSGVVRIFEGELLGFIAERPAGSAGFGYDPVFRVAREGPTLAELSPEEKNRISHRGVAWRKAEALLAHLLAGGGGRA